MIFRPLFALVVLFASSMALAQEPMRLPVHPDKLIVQSDGDVLAEFEIEIATTPDQRAAGLMHRTDLPKDRGMLFVFENESERFFWMQNTPTPLDIIYADQSGTIVHVAAKTVPFSTKAIPSYAPAKYAFEVHAELAEMFGIKVGDTLVHTIIGKK